jgi:hypothetical protein
VWPAGHAPGVPSSVDACPTFERLLGPNQVPTRFLQALQKMEVSVAIASISLTTEPTFADGDFRVTDPSLVPSGEHVVMLPWRAFT